MKIAVLGTRGLPANYSGFETCLEHTSRCWTNDGHTVLVYCRKNRYIHRPAFFESVRLKYINLIPSKSFETLSHTFLSVLDVCLKERSFKHIHLYNTGNAIFIPILKLFKKKVIISVDGIEWKRDKWGHLAKKMYKFGERLAIRWADEIIVDNQEVYDYYLNQFGKKTTLIAYGAKTTSIDASKAQTVLRKYNLNSKEYFIFVGRLVPEKGVHNLIRTYKQLNTKHPLVIIGDDHSDSEYKKQLFSQNSDYIKMLGFKFGDEYEQLLANAMLYISASHLEGTSPSLLAAMGAKVACLVNGIPENRNTAGTSILYFKESNYDDLLKIWQKAISDPDKIEEISLIGFQHVLKHYSWRKISNDYIKVLSKI